MAYGDSANWDGTIPAASYAEYKIEWKTVFKGGGTLPTCVFDVNTSQNNVAEVALTMAKAWNDQIPHARRAIHTNDNPNGACKVQFDGEVTLMQVRGYKKPLGGSPPPSESVLPFKDVEYGNKTPVLFDSSNNGKLFVFNA